MRLNRVIILLVIFLLLLLAPFAVLYLQFYQLGGGDAAIAPDYDPAQIAEVSEVPTPAASEYTDEPEVGEGFVLLDQGHDNAFTRDEIGYLDGRLAARGFEMLTHTGSDLATQLRGVTAFIVITPLDEFNDEEVRAVKDFVDRGGRLLMIGDPTRFEVLVDETEFEFTFTLERDDIPLNSLANEFNISFNGDYLYNTVENEGNFRNILLKQEDEAFAVDAITEDVERIAFYSTHSLQVGNEGEVLLRANDQTWSSATDRPGDLVLGATSMNGRVLAIGDIHFLTQPYYTVLDNSRFIAQIADFLTETSGREFVLADFPFFYRERVDLVYLGDPDLGPEAFDEIIALQEAFLNVGRDLRLADTPAGDHDVLYLGLYNESSEVADILATAGISLTISPPILSDEEAAHETETTDDDGEETGAETGAETEADETAEEEEDGAPAARLIQSELGNVQMSGTAVILWHEEDGQRQVLVLAASEAGLENTVDRLLDLTPLNADYALSDCLLQINLALCPTQVSGEEVEAELLTGGEPDDSEEEEEEAAPPAADEEEAEEDEPAEIDAVDQGGISLDETVSGTLDEGESHAWTVTEGPATVDILMESEDLDGVLELYGPDGFIAAADAGLTGEPELLEGVELETDDEYTIVVRDFWGDPGEYVLGITAVAPGEEEDEEENGETGTGIFILADDDGEPLTDGFTSADFFADQLGSEFEVTIWTSSEDGSLQPELLEGVDFIIWDSGDYRDEEFLLDEDSEIIFDYLDSGQGSLLVVGASPVIFSYLETSPLSDLEVSVDDPILTEGLEPGAILELDGTYQAVIPEFFVGDEADNEVVFLLRGPDSEDEGNAAAFANEELSFEGQKSAFVLFPFTALPDDVEETLLVNLVAWFDINP